MGGWGLLTFFPRKVCVCVWGGGGLLGGGGGGGGGGGAYWEEGAYLSAPGFNIRD